MPSPALKRVSMIQDNTQTNSLGIWEDCGTGYGYGKLSQERITDAEMVKVTAKKEAKNVKRGRKKG